MLSQTLRRADSRKAGRLPEGPSRHYSVWHLSCACRHMEMALHRVLCTLCVATWSCFQFTMNYDARSCVYPRCQENGTKKMDLILKGGQLFLSSRSTFQSAAHA